MFRLISAVAFLIAAAPAPATSLDGLPVAASVRLEPEGIELALRGGYVRTYFLRKTTSYALYSGQPVRDFAALVAAPDPKRMVVTVLMSRFEAAQFRSSWIEQFERALSPEERSRFAVQIAQFMSAFETLGRGDQLAFDLVPGEGLRMSLRGQPKLAIAGDDFAIALFSVWLGPRSVDRGLANAMFAAR